jgi:hypothetical protein
MSGAVWFAKKSWYSLRNIWCCKLFSCGRAEGMTAMVFNHAGDVSWEYSSLIDALNRFMLSYFERNKAFYTHRSSIILAKQQILLGRPQSSIFLPIQIQKAALFAIAGRNGAVR